jgi:hypothetical protein
MGNQIEPRRTDQNVRLFFFQRLDNVRATPQNVRISTLKCSPCSPKCSPGCSCEHNEPTSMRRVRLFAIVFAIGPPSDHP